MATPLYDAERTVVVDRYTQRELFMKERFTPGEFGAVAMMGVAALLLWALALYGMCARSPVDSPTMIDQMYANSPASYSSTDLNAPLTNPTTNPANPSTNETSPSGPKL